MALATQDGKLVYVEDEVIGSDLIPDLSSTPAGALRSYTPSSASYEYDEDEDTISIPRFDYITTKPELGGQKLQDVYGTSMASYQFFEPIFTGQYDTYKVDSGGLTDAQKAKIEIDQEAQRKALLENQQQVKEAGQRSLGATGANIGRAAAESYIGQGLARDAGFFSGDTVSQTAGDAFRSVNPLGGLDKEVIRDPEVLRSQQLEQGQRADYRALGRGGYGDTFSDRINPFQDGGLSPSAKVAGTGMFFDAAFQIASGRDPVDAFKDAGKTAAYSFIADAILPGSGRFVAFLSKFF